MTRGPDPRPRRTLLSVCRGLTRWVAERLLPDDSREFIVGDLEELHRTWTERHGRAAADRRYIRALGASVLARLGRRARRPARDAWRSRTRHTEEFVTDLRHAARDIRRRPGLVAAVSLTLGIGVGGAATVFGMVDQLLLRPPPGVHDAGTAAFLEFATPDRGQEGVSIPLARAVREAAGTLSGLATFDYLQVHLSADGGRPLNRRSYTVFGDYFELLEVRPRVGRLLAASETGPGSDPTRAVISESLWDDLFARDPDVVGRHFEANGKTLTVLGVAAEGFRGTDRSWGVDLWVPRSAFSLLTNYPIERLWLESNRLNQDFVVRAADGASTDAVASEVNAILQGLAQVQPDQATYLSTLKAVVHPGVTIPVGRRSYVLPALTVFSVAGLLILLITCANVTNLLLVRASRSSGEIAVRRALGASKSRIVRGALVRSLLLATSGVVVGFGVAWLIGRAIQGESLWGFPGFEGLALDWSVVIFAGGSIVVTALLSGIVPAMVEARFKPEAGLRDVAPQATRRHDRLRHAMSALQIGLSLSLLIGSILLLRTVRNLFDVDPGLDMAGVYVASIDMGTESLEGDALRAFHRRLLDGLADVPGVSGVALQSFYGPYEGALSSRVTTSPDADEAPAWLGTHWVTPGWFDLLGVAAVRGRLFRAGESASATHTSVVVTSKLANRLFGGTDVVGRALWIGGRDLHEARIIGVVGDVRLIDLASPPDEALFLPYPPDQTDPVTALIRVTDSGAGAAERLQRAIAALAPAFPIPQLQLLRSRVEEDFSEQRVLSRLLGVFSTLALLLAGVGLYGVIAFTVAGRRREFAIRMALGADRARISKLALRSALFPVLVGTALGLVGAYGLSRLLESHLFGIAALDPASYLGAAALMATVAIVAAWLPARTAARTDSVTTLASE